MKQEEQVVLVDISDRVQGVASKIYVHTDALLHRAFSVMIYNYKGELLLQKRADCKYHSAGLWTNSCCGHPKEDETPEKAARRRLYEELGFTCDLQKTTELSYFLSLNDNMYENEYTHIFSGIYEGTIIPNDNEVSDINWIKPDLLLRKVSDNPQLYSRWLRLYLEEYYNKIFVN